MNGVLRMCKFFVSSTTRFWLPPLIFRLEFPIALTIPPSGREASVFELFLNSQEIVPFPENLRLEFELKEHLPSSGSPRSWKYVQKKSNYVTSWMFMKMFMPKITKNIVPFTQFLHSFTVQKNHECKNASAKHKY